VSNDRWSNAIDELASRTVMPSRNRDYPLHPHSTSREHHLPGRQADTVALARIDAHLKLTGEIVSENGGVLTGT